MLAVDRTTKQFVAALKENFPQVDVSVQKSRNNYGRSNYVYIISKQVQKMWKVRISDHPIGPWRFKHGNESFFINAGAKPQAWSIWMGEFAKEVSPPISEQR